MTGFRREPARFADHDNGSAESMEDAKKLVPEQGL
jgi:hypothetical protein